MGARKYYLIRKAKSEVMPKANYFAKITFATLNDSNSKKYFWIFQNF